MDSKKSSVSIYDLGIFIILGFILMLFSFYKIETKKANEKVLIALHKTSLKTFDEVYITEYKKNIENDLNFLYSQVEYSKIGDENYRENLLTSWDLYKKNRPYIKWIYLAYDENTILIDKKWQKPKDFFMKKRVWYREGIINEGIYWTEPYEDATNKKVVISITKQIKDQNDIVKGVLAFDIDLYMLSEKISFMDINKENFIFDKNYRILAHTNFAYLNQKLKNSDYEKKIENNKDGYFFDKDQNAYVFIKNSLQWTIVKKIPKENLVSLNKSGNNIYYLFVLLVMLALIHILYNFKVNEKNRKALDLLKAIKNREDIKDLFPKKITSSEKKLVEEIYSIQRLIDDLEKEVLRDEETGLFSESYLLTYGKTLVKKEQKILLLKYLNLGEVKNQYGKDVVELVLKRGAMTLNAMKEREELTFRLEKDTLAIVLNSGDVEKRANYIVDEILNYKWKLHNISLSLTATLLGFEEYKKR